MTENERIIKWNEDRNLIKDYSNLNIMKEISFIIEECIEMVTPMNSEEAREMAELMAEQIVSQSTKTISREQIVDAAADIKVFATGLIRKVGYDPDIVMDEVITEIESRKGSIQGGKFTKDKSPEAQEKWYKADFTKADLIDI